MHGLVLPEALWVGISLDARTMAVSCPQGSGSRLSGAAPSFTGGSQRPPAWRGTQGGEASPSSFTRHFLTHFSSLSPQHPAFSQVHPDPVKPSGRGPSPAVLDHHLGTCILQGCPCHTPATPRSFMWGAPWAPGFVRTCEVVVT